jgi:LysM repeat protein
MKKNTISLGILLCSISMFSQSSPSSKEYRRIILDGKTAYMNIKTHEILPYNPDKQDKPDANSYVAPELETTIVSETDITSNTHIVSAGETLYSISKKYGISIDKLKQLNPHLDINSLSEKQQIIINNDSNINSYKPAVKPVLETIVAPIKDTMIKTNIVTNEYIVKQGETLYGICKKLNISVSDLKRLNNLDSNLISIGQSLKIK